MVDWLKVLLNKGLAAKLLLKLIEHQEAIMAQLDDLKAAQEETQTKLGELSTSLTDVAADVDKLLTLITAQPIDLTEVLALAASIRDTTASLAAGAAMTAGKFDSTV